MSVCVSVFGAEDLTTPLHPRAALLGVNCNTPARLDKPPHVCTAALYTLNRTPFVCTCGLACVVCVCGFGAQFLSHQR